jgi:hypothetical protein
MKRYATSSKTGAYSGSGNFSPGLSTRRLVTPRRRLQTKNFWREGMPPMGGTILKTLGALAVLVGGSRLCRLRYAITW